MASYGKLLTTNLSCPNDEFCLGNCRMLGFSGFSNTEGLMAQCPPAPPPCSVSLEHFIERKPLISEECSVLNKKKIGLKGPISENLKRYCTAYLNGIGQVVLSKKNESDFLSYIRFQIAVMYISKKALFGTHSSEISGLCLMKLSSETQQNLLNFVMLCC